jgi:glycosyltransferase involved in cell wall biosynthesis
MMAQDRLSKLFWWLQWRKMERYELQACQQFTGVVTVSEIDKIMLEEQFGAKNVFAIPTGIDTSFFAPREDPIEENSLVFTGSMDWLPNEDAMLFFVREILGRIKTQIPSIKLTVVGKNPSPRLLNELQKYPEVKAVGWVKDVRPFISQSALSILPLRIGGGTRIKVYEAMAMGKVMVSTRIGVEGLPVQNGVHIALADSSEEFAHAIVQFLQEPARRHQVEEAARDFVQKNCSWKKAAEVFAESCWTVVNSCAHGQVAA